MGLLEAILGLGELLANQPIVAAFIVIFYLHYQLLWGRLAAYLDKLDGIVAIVIALAEEVDNVDEEAVAGRFNGTDSSEYIDDTNDTERYRRR